jgi:hypothetical protein
MATGQKRERGGREKEKLLLIFFKVKHIKSNTDLSSTNQK